MKTPLLASLLLALAPALFLPLCGQTAAPDSNSGVQTIAPPSRNIMPMSTTRNPNPVPPPPEIRASIDKFFATLRSGDYVGAYDNFLANTRLGAQTEKKSVFISKTQDGLGLYGKLTDWELYDNYSIGSNVIVVTYLSRQAAGPLRWRFVFYRPDKTWGLINMGFDDALVDQLD